MSVGVFHRSMYDEPRDDVDIERHLWNALERAENDETRYHLREALQKRQIETQ